MHENTRLARAAGYQRWVARIREAKARGEIERFPGGRRKRGLPPLSKDRRIRRAQRIIEAKMAKAVVAPVSDASAAELLSSATHVSLVRVQELLNREIDPAQDYRLYALQISTALSTIASQIRIESAALMASSVGRDMADDELGQRLGRAMSRLAMYEAEEAEALEGEAVDAGGADGDGAAEAAQ
jgi:hypothetical protein